MNRNIASAAIVLSSKSIGEADKLVTVYSRNFGKLTLIAKGVKRLKSRKRGALEVFSVIKFSAHNGHGMPIMTEAEVVNGFSDIRHNLKKISVAYFFLEVVLRATRDEEPHGDVYDLLEDFLAKLTESTNLKSLRREFTIQLSEMLGFIPQEAHVPNPDELLESIIERKLGSVRVGKKLQT